MGKGDFPKSGKGSEAKCKHCQKLLTANHAEWDCWHNPRNSKPEAVAKRKAKAAAKPQPSPKSRGKAGKKGSPVPTGKVRCSDAWRK